LRAQSAAGALKMEEEEGEEEEEGGREAAWAGPTAAAWEGAAAAWSKGRNAGESIDAVLFQLAREELPRAPGALEPARA
jgi:hypothetical protein